MKKLLILFIIIASLSSCINQDRLKSREFYVSFSNDGRWTSTRVYCDSFKMQSREEIILYVDGVSLKYFSKDILVGTNFN